ncbi:MAG: hypothetical protein ACLFR0_05260 [Alphaproteobacteria bacterium]
MLNSLINKFRDAMAWEQIKTNGINIYWENSRTGDRMSVKQKNSFLGIQHTIGFSPIDRKWLSQAKGRAIIWDDKGQTVIEHDDLHRLVQRPPPPAPLPLPRNARSAVQKPQEEPEQP